MAAEESALGGRLLRHVKVCGSDWAFQPSVNVAGSGCGTIKYRRLQAYFHVLQQQRSSLHPVALLSDSKSH